MKRYFIDSNIIVYANDRRDPKKQSQAIKIVESLIRHQNGVISTQVLQEYASTALTKLQQDASIILRQLKLFESLHIVAHTPAMIRHSVELHAAYKVSYWDAAIIAAAESADCDALLSEDFNTGQYYSGVEVINAMSQNFDIAGLHT